MVIEVCTRGLTQARAFEIGLHLQTTFRQQGLLPVPAEVSECRGEQPAGQAPLQALCGLYGKRRVRRCPGPKQIVVAPVGVDFVAGDDDTLDIGKTQTALRQGRCNGILWECGRVLVVVEFLLAERRQDNAAGTDHNSRIVPKVQSEYGHLRSRPLRQDKKDASII